MLELDFRLEEERLNVLAKKIHSNIEKNFFFFSFHFKKDCSLNAKSTKNNKIKGLEGYLVLVHGLAK